MVSDKLIFMQSSDDAVCAEDEATPGMLRICSGVLQQEWTTKQYLAGGGFKFKAEWRDVPVEL